MARVLVKNTHRDGGSGWLNRWKRYKGKSPNEGVYCSNLKHKEEERKNVYAEHGGHVKKVNHRASEKYIVPLCANCNEQKNDNFHFYVEQDDMVLERDLKS